MSKDFILNQIRRYVLYHDVENAVVLTKKALEMELKPMDIIEGSLASGLREVGELFASGKIHLPELMVSAVAFKESMKIIEPMIKKEELKNVGKIIIGTVKSDIHDIGKGIVSVLLSAAGFEVLDLGVDIPPSKFVEEAKISHPDFVMMSALMTASMPFMETTIRLLKNRKLHPRTMVGGAPVTEEFAHRIGADGFAEEAIEAVAVAKILMRNPKK